MKIFFIYDLSVVPKNVNLSFLDNGDMVYLFPLTSKVYLTAAIIDRIKSKGCVPEVVPTARMVNLAAENLRDKYISFIAGLPGKINYKGKDLREFFAIDRDIALWWFSLIAEKNTYKSDSFNRF